MDVFVCDNIPDDEKLRIDYFSKCTYERNMSWGMRNVRARRPNGGFLSRLSYLKQRMPIFWEECILGRDIVNEHCNRLTRVAQAYNDMKTEYVSHTTFKPCYGDRLCVLVPRKYFEELVLVSFEGFQVSATKYADEYLTMIYKNWRKYVVGSNEHGGVLFDADRSYVEYLKED